MASQRWSGLNQYLDSSIRSSKSGKSQIIIDNLYRPSSEPIATFQLQIVILFPSLSSQVTASRSPHNPPIALFLHPTSSYFACRPRAYRLQIRHRQTAAQLAHHSGWVSNYACSQQWPHRTHIRVLHIKNRLQSYLERRFRRESLANTDVRASETPPCHRMHKQIANWDVGQYRAAISQQRMIVCCYTQIYRYQNTQGRPNIDGVAFVWPRSISFIVILTIYAVVLHIILCFIVLGIAVAIYQAANQGIWEAYPQRSQPQKRFRGPGQNFEGGFKDGLPPPEYARLGFWRVVPFISVIPSGLAIALLYTTIFAPRLHINTSLQMDIRCILSAYMGVKTEGSSLICVVGHVIPVWYVQA